MAVFWELFIVVWIKRGQYFQIELELTYTLNRRMMVVKICNKRCRSGDHNCCRCCCVSQIVPFYIQLIKKIPYFKVPLFCCWFLRWKDLLKRFWVLLLMKGNIIMPVANDLFSLGKNTLTMCSPNHFRLGNCTFFVSAFRQFPGWPP